MQWAQGSNAIVSLGRRPESRVGGGAQAAHRPWGALGMLVTGGGPQGLVESCSAWPLARHSCVGRRLIFSGTLFKQQNRNIADACGKIDRNNGVSRESEMVQMVLHRRLGLPLLGHVVCTPRQGSDTLHRNGDSSHRKCVRGLNLPVMVSSTVPCLSQDK